VLIEFTYSLYQRHSRESGNPENTPRFEYVLLDSRFRGNDVQHLFHCDFYHLFFSTLENTGSDVIMVW